MASDLKKYTENMPATVKELKAFKDVAHRRYEAQMAAVKAMESIDGAEVYVKKAAKDAGEWEIKAWLAEARIGDLLGDPNERKKRKTVSDESDTKLNHKERDDRFYSTKFYEALESGSLAKNIENVESNGPVAYRLPLSTAHVSHNSGNNEWYTPKEYITAVHDVMGEIDLDPASSKKANEVVGAKRFFTETDDAFSADWIGNIFMNPPYASGLISPFCEKFSTEVVNGNIKQGIVLVNNATETAWFLLISSVSDALCHPTGRIPFWSPGKESAAPLQGQAILYSGNNIKGFVDRFKTFGQVWKKA